MERDGPRTDADTRARSLITSEDETRAIALEFLALRASFFAATLRKSGMEKWEFNLREMEASELDLTHPSIKRQADKYLGSKLDKPEFVRIFCPVEVTRQWPGLIDYYRGIALVSDKFFGRLFPALSSRSRGFAPKEDSLEHEVKTLNNIMEGLFDRGALSRQIALTNALLTLGSAITGAWNNEVGRLGVFRVARIISEEFEDEVLQIILRTSEDQHLSFKEDREFHKLSSLEGQGALITEICLRDGFTFHFGQDPDVRLMDNLGKLIAGGEVKGAIDPANVWERWPIAEKTLRRLRTNYPNSKRFFVAYVVNESLAMGAGGRPGVKQALSSDNGEPLAHAGFNLHHLQTMPDERKSFGDFFRSLMSKKRRQGQRTL